MEKQRPELEMQEKRLRELRAEAGMNRKKFAEYFGIPLRTVEDWEAGKRKMPEYLLRLIAYKVKLDTLKSTMTAHTDLNNTSAKINIISDENGKGIVIINDIRFKGKQHIDWNEVESYVREYVGSCYEIIETSDIIYIGSDFPGELKGSEDMKRLKDANVDEKYGWCKCTSRFALPVYSSEGELERYNVFFIELFIEHASDNRLYLNDMVKLKKKTEYPA